MCNGGVLAVARCLQFGVSPRTIASARITCKFNLG